MAKSTPSIVLFVILFSITGFFIGLILSRFLIPKGVGLAGGAMVFSYGILGLFIALIAGLISQRYLSKNHLKWGSILCGIFNLAIIGWVIFKMNTN